MIVSSRDNSLASAESVSSQQLVLQALSFLLCLANHTTLEKIGASCGDQLTCFCRFGEVRPPRSFRQGWWLVTVSRRVWSLSVGALGTAAVQSEPFKGTLTPPPSNLPAVPTRLMQSLWTLSSNKQHRLFNRRLSRSHVKTKTSFNGLSCG